MRYIFSALFFLNSLQSLAAIEYRQGLILPPHAVTEASAHGCFRELRLMGCGHPSSDQEFFHQCAEEKFHSMTRSCQTFFKKLNGNKS